MSAAGPAGPVPSAAELGRVHFIGIGGAGMSSIARIMLARGMAVSGSDAKDSAVLGDLRDAGARVSVGHSAEQLGAADTVVVSTAVRAESNPELAAARARGLRVLPRAAALAALMADRRSVAVAGTHGKTTTTGMLTVALRHAGADPSFAIGGLLADTGQGGHHGGGDVFVAEADESDGSFLYYSPHAAVVTNVEADHLDHFGTGEAVDAAFAAFARRITPGGFLVTCADDPGAVRLAEAARAEGMDVRTYGEHEGADLRVHDVVLTPGGARFAATCRGALVGETALSVAGRHNVHDAAAALAAGLGLGFDAADLLAGLAAFRGTRRRFELRGERAGVRVYDDYAHHPTELVAMLTAAREAAGGGRLVVAFQPHRYSRTAAFREGFGEALALADLVVVTEVYSAGEDPIPQATGASVAEAVALPAGRVSYVPARADIAARLADLVVPGDLVVTAGAGDVTLVGPELLDLLGRPTAAPAPA